MHLAEDDAVVHVHGDRLDDDGEAVLAHQPPAHVLRPHARETRPTTQQRTGQVGSTHKTYVESRRRRRRVVWVATRAVGHEHTGTRRCDDATKRACVEESCTRACLMMPEDAADRGAHQLERQHTTTRELMS